MSFGRMKTKTAETRVFTSGQGGKFTVDTAVYEATIVGMTAYTTGNGEAVKGILEVTLPLPNGGERTYKQHLNLVSKDGKSTYTDAKSGAEVLFEDVSILTEICGIVCKKNPEDMESVDTMIEIHDFSTNSKKPVPASVLPDLVGKKIELAIMEYEEPKRKQVNGEWVDTDDIQLKNKIELVLQPGSHKTIKELRAKSEEAVAHDTWVGYWAGKVKEYSPRGKKGKTVKSSEKASSIPEVADEDFEF